MKLRARVAMAGAIARNAILGRAPGRAIDDRPERFGITAVDPACRERIRGVLRSFFSGLESAARRWGRSLPECGELDSLYHPFFHEGAAMGLTIARRASLRSLPSLARNGFGREEPFVFLRVVGVGFALGFLRSRRPGAAVEAAPRFENLGPLLADGYGFCRALFDWRGDAVSTAASLDRLQGDSLASALNGVGRCLWFRSMERPREAVEAARGASEPLALLGGLGLAAAFTFPDDLRRAYDLADSLERDERAALAEGIRIGLFVRHRDQEAWLAERLEAQSPRIRRRAREDIEAALEANAASCREPDYIARFHRLCREG